MIGLFIGLRVAVAGLWLALAFTGWRRWRRKAVLWVVLSFPLALALAAVLPDLVLYWICTRPPGCMSAGM